MIGRYNERDLGESYYLYFGRSCMFRGSNLSPLIELPARASMLSHSGVKIVASTMFAFFMLAASSSAQTEIPVTEQIDQAESKLTGHVDSQSSVEQRIAGLEVKLFGKKSKGAFSSRLLKIWKALGSSPHAAVSAAAPAKAVAPPEVPHEQADAATTPAKSSAATDSHSSPATTTDAVAAPSTPTAADSPIAEPAAAASTPQPQAIAAAIAPSDETMRLQSEVSQSEVHASAKAAELDSHSDKELVARARQLEESGRIAEAQTVLNHVTNRNINDAEAYALMGDIAFRAGDAPDALRNYWIARNLEPANLSYHGRISTTEGIIKSRVPHYHIWNYYPESHDVRSIVNEGVRMWGSNMPDQAVLFFQHALKMDPTNINAYYNLGAISEWQGNLPQALAYYLHANTLLDRQKAYPWLGSTEQPSKDPTKRLVSGLARGVLTTAGVRLPMLNVAPKPIPQIKGNPYLSGGEDTTDLHSEIPQAIVGVRQRMELHAGQTPIPIFSVTQNVAHTDTCDRCRILRTKAMGPD